MRFRICALASAICVLALIPATADARPTILKPLLQPVLQPLQPLDRQLLDLDADGGGTLEELLLESCDPIFNKDTDNGGVGDGDELDNGTDCTNPLDDFPPDNDLDDDGFPAPLDCNDSDPNINPGEIDPPDPDAIDANCDGFDGDPAQGVFVALTGDDANPGTRAAPKRTVQAAIDTALAEGKDVFLDSAIFDDDNPAGVTLRDGVNLYGGYRSVDNWERRNIIGATRIEGAPQAATANGVTAELQLLELRGEPDANKTAYGLRAVGGSNITVRRSRIRALDGVAGARGDNGANGAIGRAGESGGTGDEDGASGAGGGAGVGAGFNGGGGGHGGGEGNDPGDAGASGSGPNGGSAGAGGINQGCGDGSDGGEPGGDGGNGGGGTNGTNATGASNSLGGAGSLWSASIAGSGSNGTSGSGGGGGGGGGGQGEDGVEICDDGGGAGGGGGGAGGERGVGGTRGTAGGGSFAIYLFNSTVTLADGSFAISGDGGAGGQGGQGGQGGVGGEGGAGGVTTDGGLFQGVDGETGVGGKGGNGGNGGNGGAGGGGAGGPSAAIGSFGTSTANVAGSTLTHGAGGAGGSSPAGGSSNGAAGQSADILP